MTKAKKRLSKFNFEDEGAAVALVGKFQGGPANNVTTLITKSTSDISEEELNKALDESETDLTSSVESEGEDVVTKAEDVKQTKEEVEMTQEEIQEMIAKAAGDLAKEQVEAIEKAYAEKAEKAEKELNVLKAAHDARVHQEYLVKAAELAAFVGEDADKEAIAKALRAVEAIEEAAPLLQVLKALKDTASKDELFEEVGKSATEEQPSDFESKVEVLTKSLMEKNPSLKEFEAYIQAADELRGA